MAFIYDIYSPIHWVAANAEGTQDLLYVRSPSKYEYQLQDVSAPDSGRTEDGLMHKDRVGQVCKLVMSWDNIDTQSVSQLLQIFQPEYLYAEYLDAYTGAYRIDRFYVGDRSAPLYNSKRGLWSSVAFNLIRQEGGSLIT